MKLVVNMVMGSMMAAFSEVLPLVDSRRWAARSQRVEGGAGRKPVHGVPASFPPPMLQPANQPAGLPPQPLCAVQGLALAGQAGLSEEVLLEVLDLGAMSNPMFRWLGGWVGGPATAGAARAGCCSSPAGRPGGAQARGRAGRQAMQQ
jgi:hypothetical protein